MITASKANSSRSGPLENVKVVRMPRTTPATATIASDSAIASPYSRPVSMPINAAVAPSSDAARKARPIGERPMTSCRAMRSTTASAKVSSGNAPTASPPPRGTLAVSIPPGFSRRESAEKISSSPFWITIDSPKVTSTAGRIPRPNRRLSANRWSP